MKASNTSKTRVLGSLLLLIAVVLSACSGGATPTPAPTETALPPTATLEPTPEPVNYSSMPFVGKTWYWLGTQFNDDTTLSITDPAQYSVQFNSDGTYNGQADCNQFTGSFTVEGAAITMLPGIMTLAACPEGSQSDAFLQQLGNVATYLLQDGFLYLDIAMDSGTMQFSEQPVAPASAEPYADSPIVGKVWQWLRLEMSDGTTTTVPTPPSYTIQFFADGTLQGQADCNTFSGTFTTQDASLAIQMGPMTLVACPEGSLSDQYVQRLGEVATYVIQNGALFMNLTLDSGNMVFGEEPIAVLPEPAPGQPAATATSNVNVRNGPGTNYPVYGVMPFGRTAEVVGKSADGAWWALNLPVAPLGQGWVSADFVGVGGAENVPVLPTPPVPATTEFTPPGPDDPQVVALDTVYVRSGPSEQYPAYGAVQSGAAGLVIGRSQDGLYWVVRVNPTLISTGFAWVPAAYTVAENVSEVPAIEAPPLPSSVAMPTPPTGAASGVAMTALNVRSGPGTNFPILAVAPAGAVGEITGRSSDNAWWQVRVPTTVSADGFGWVSADFVFASNTANVPVVNPPSSGVVTTPAPTVIYPTQQPPSGTTAPSGKVMIGTTTDTVNLRAGPGNEYESYGVLPAGATGVIIGSNSAGTWYTFSVSTSIAKDGKGWVSASYVKVQEVNYATATAMATPFTPPSGGGTVTPGATSQPPVTNACKIIEKKPVDGTVYKPNFEFDMKATLKNTGTSAWETSLVDVVFVKALNSIPIHTSPDSYDLQETVNSGSETTLFVDMKAPSQPGTYGETWAVVQGSTTLCQWSITITVQK